MGEAGFGLRLCRLIVIGREGTGVQTCLAQCSRLLLLSFGQKFKTLLFTDVEWLLLVGIRSKQATLSFSSDLILVFVCTFHIGRFELRNASCFGSWLLFCSSFRFLQQQPPLL